MLNKSITTSIFGQLHAIILVTQTNLMTEGIIVSLQN